MDRQGEINMTEYVKLMNNLEALELIKIKSYLPEYLDKNKKNSTMLINCLRKLTEMELEDKMHRASENLIRTAAFPFRKTLEDFDFSFNDSIDKDYIMDLATLRFAEDNKNILFLGDGIFEKNWSYYNYFNNRHYYISFWFS